MQSENIWLKDHTAPVVLLSGGIGITPVLAMLENMDSKQPVIWLHGSENGTYHPYRARLQRLASIRKSALKRRVWYVAPTEADGTPEPDDNTGNFHYEGLMDLSHSQMPKAELHLDNDHTEHRVLHVWASSVVRACHLLARGLGRVPGNSHGGLWY